ncbi:MAG: zinc-dependent alcohol dehydrogenase, partial [Solirubrobacteraceae bacterium]
MRALVWKGGAQLDYEEVPDPGSETDEVVLDVELAGICGSDLHGYRGHPGPRVPPLVLGHEAVGRIEDERFAVYPILGCGKCERCVAGEDNLCPRWRLLGMHRPGVFAERVAVPRAALVPVPQTMSSQVAVLTEPLACALGALRPHAVGPGTRMVVLGCGPIGLLSVLLAADQGAEVLAVDPLASRRELAMRLGAKHAAGAAEDLEPQAADLVLDAAGFEATWRAALELLRSGGEMVALGLGDAEGTFPMASLIRRGIRLRGQFAYSRAEFAAALETVDRLDVDFSWLSIEPLAEGARAFAGLVEQPERHIKTLLM